MRRAENNKHSRYSIRKLSVGVTSIAIASLFLGKVAYAVDSMQPISSTQGNRANTSKKWYDINEYGLIPVDISFEAAKKDFKEEVEKSLLSEEQQKTYNQKIEAARNKDDLLLTYHSEYSKDIKKHSTSTEPVEASVQETQASVSDSMVTDDSTSVTADSPEKTPSTETPAPSIPEVPEAPASSPESEESSVASSEETSSPETPVAPEAPALSEAPAQPAESEESSVAATTSPSPSTPAESETQTPPAVTKDSDKPSSAAEKPAASSLVSEQTVQQPTSKRSSDKKEEQEQSYSPNRSLSRQVRAHESGKYLPSTGEKAQPLFIATMTLMSLFGSLLVTKRQKETKK
ncbi:TPA: YSIRK-type signal peptide-containing protein [Streptococcus pyogenes]|uniref:YSIRK-type signal peptide-containing protein n=1 Tax=Streptococcus pyogenes TaxID=1314 RepID=UPI0013F5ED37|nr:YSIRK-type signal peptide-containing protein [Streptococcus pyogenes]HEP4261870.1 YSIRK-type signal peptide-containing protein [Streptococcus pyogenes]HEP5052108.1 YSIRK-type signal peptide-containing protein [Streptococcus pyogenes]HEP5291042.1 YSIRK-type signal peptide-containing protein [Streptococcus pyogenes]HEP5481380.1 YSIRK-type signal peptide-containing protein [Streptococcus pyogenes]